ncbi:hypothetical protein GCM10027565_18660 [Bordetella tumulicola]
MSPANASYGKAMRSLKPGPTHKGKTTSLKCWRKARIVWESSEEIEVAIEIWRTGGARRK